MRDLEPIQLGQAYIKKDQIRLELRRHLDRFQTVGRFSNHLQACIAGQRETYLAADGREIPTTSTRNAGVWERSPLGRGAPSGAAMRRGFSFRSTILYTLKVMGTALLAREKIPITGTGIVAHGHKGRRCRNEQRCLDAERRNWDIGNRSAYRGWARIRKASPLRHASVVCLWFSCTILFQAREEGRCRKLFRSTPSVC